jgi:hypothetical protein
MSIKQNLEAIYCKLPRPIIEILAPKSDIYEIQQAQKYSKTEFENPNTKVVIDYVTLLEKYRQYRTGIIFANCTGRNPYISISDKSFSFEQYIKPYIKSTINNKT